MSKKRRSNVIIGPHIDKRQKFIDPEPPKLDPEPPKEMEPDTPLTVNTLDDIHTIAREYQGKNIDTNKIWRLLPDLFELNDLIGMVELKKKILDIIVYRLQYPLNNDGDLLHTVLLARPGYGKTSVINILGRIYSRLLFDSDNVVMASRADLIGKFIGETEAKCQKVFERAMGGVLILDEVYSLGQAERVDSFSKVIIDTLNQYLSEHKNDFVCLIAGYEKEVDECFFANNPGLKRRFPWTFKIETYSEEDLSKILFYKINQRWKTTVELSDIIEIFKDKFKYFPNAGGDIEILWTYVKISHARTIFGCKSSNIITIEDIKDGMKRFLSESEPKDVDESWKAMYL